jgi:hypothetical protein
MRAGAPSAGLHRRVLLDPRPDRAGPILDAGLLAELEVAPHHAVGVVGGAGEDRAVGRGPVLEKVVNEGLERGIGAGLDGQLAEVGAELTEGQLLAEAAAHGGSRWRGGPG